MSLASKVFAAPARLWMNWPLWGGLLAMLLLAKHAWVLFAPAEHAVPASAIASRSDHAEQLFGTVNTSTSSASLNGIRPVGIFAAGENGFAVMQTESGQVGVAVGNQVVPGIRLAETHADYVILERNGARQRVDLVKIPTATGGITPVQDNNRLRDDLSPATKIQQRVLDRLTPEQRAMLQQQQQDMTRGRH
ncbi:hypothetical protein [Sideroxydans lithotrophicus]|uniref:Type II secretion system protein GspC N-terminal domain-containing protein n=1 Tax=Sideroxydans lithotrophicus (strain ES-1) TaxID=580332 RepID=D5CMQ4_SIDLE|nr:hypothetical protein [Sideroxydans lithotrophicus]ADE10740.1 hypothetical protein Slit_0500 [Sideroxydans lithotrophicus ES-1]